METIDRDSILASKAVVGFMSNSSSVEQQLPFHAKIKGLFPDLVWSPHSDGISFLHRELQCLIQPEISPDDNGTLVQFRKNAACEAIENAQVRISIKIVRQPADGKATQQHSEPVKHG
jgi:hypothetical protein